MKRLALIALTLIFTSPVQTNAQERVIAIDSLQAIAYPPLLKGETVLQFDTPVLAIGKLSEDDAPVTYRFSFRNVSPQPVTLTRITTSCGCTVAQFGKQPIEPGRESTIELTFNPFEKAGTVDTQAFIYTDLSAKSPTARVTLRGEVSPTSNQWVNYPQAMGVLRLKRSTLTFRALSQSSPTVERMVCINSGEKALRLSSLLKPAYVTFRTEPEVIPPGTEADLVITIDGRLLPVGIKETFEFPIVLEGINARPSDRTILVKATLSKTEY